MKSPRPISEAQALLELEQLKTLKRAQAAATALHVERLAAQAKAARVPRGQRSPGLPASRMCNPSTYVCGADLRELGGQLLRKHRAELVQQAKRRGWGTLSPTALAIASVLWCFRGLRSGRDGCGIQAPVTSWARELGCSPRQVSYAFAQLERCGWVKRRRRLVRHVWVDIAGNSWRQADTHAVAYLLNKGAVQLEPASWKQNGQRRVIGLLGNLLKLAGKNLRVLHRRVTDALNRCRPTALPYKSFKNPDGAGLRPPLSTGPPGPTPSGHRSTGRAEHREDAELTAAGPQGEGATSAQQRWPDLWARSDQRGKLWLHAHSVGVQLPGPSTSEKLRAARRAWVRRNRR
jgi:DNA-binding MarR family transcriptional regulator